MTNRKTTRFSSHVKSRLYGWRWEKINNRLFDFYYGTDTHRESLLSDEGITVSQAQKGNSVYRPFWKTEFNECITSLERDLSFYTFVDVGSGKGKLLLLASRFPFVESIGIEYTRGLHQTAMENIRKFKRRSNTHLNISSVHADALEWEMPNRPAVYFVYNAFDYETTNAFFAKLEKHILKTKVSTIIIYGNLRDISEREDAFQILKSFTVHCRTRRYIVFVND